MDRDNYNYESPIRIQNQLLEETVKSSAMKRKTGQWLINSDGYYPYCSLCHNEPENGKMTDYCPNCGAHMKEEK